MLVGMLAASPSVPAQGAAEGAVSAETATATAVSDSVRRGVSGELSRPPEAASRVPSGPAAESGRPAFRLPDIVVAGEDQSRLGGGVRMLGAEVPGISPEQEPLLIEPGVTQYRRRRSRPFAVAWPPRATVYAPHGWLRARAAGGPFGSLVLLALPRQRPQALLWMELESWQERVPDREHSAIDLGWREVHSPRDPTWRLAFDLRGARETWQGVDRPDRESEQDAAATCLHLERGGTLAGRQLVWTGELAAGASRTRFWDPAPDAQDRQRRTDSWLVLTGGVRTLPAAPDLRTLDDTGVVLALSGAFARLDGPWSSARSGARWSGRWAWRQPMDLGTLELGWAGEGDAGHEQTLWAPHLRYERSWRAAGTHLALTISPRRLYADGPLRRARRGTGTRALMGRGLDWFATPFPTVGTTELPPQDAWPRYALSLVRVSPNLDLRLGASAAQWKRPFDWQSIGPTTDRDLWTLVGAAHRWVVEGTIAGEWRIAEPLEFHLRYRGLREMHRPDGVGRLRFLPEHEAVSAVRFTPGIWLAELAAHARSRVATGAADETIAPFVTYDGRCGVRLGAHLVALVIENLTAAPAALRPHEVSDARWFGIEWNHAFGTHVP
ncbi:MAG: hypothetical protein GF330_08200 [Candidatus Eisenbacteria bacterium]|nr:hypothetical protein [Candidatus Eisenbacteria bacterium]